MFIVGSFFYPVLFFISLSCALPFLINRKNYVFLTFLFSLFFIFYGMAMDPVSYIGDYSRYYLTFYQPDIQILATGKLYRFSIFSILQNLNMGPQFYTGLSLFFNYMIVFLVSMKFTLLFTDGSAKKLRITFFLVLISLPSTAIGNFESILSFSICYLVIYFLCTQRKVMAFIFIFLAPLVHPAAILFSVMFIPALFFKKIFYKFKMFFSILLVAGIVAFLFLPVDNILPFLGHIQRKLVGFLTGPWSEYIERRDFEFIIIAIVKSFVFLISIYRIKQVFINRKVIKMEESKTFNKKIYAIDMLYNISCYMFPVIILAIFSRTLAERYIYFGMFFFLPIVILAIESMQISLNRRFIYSMIFLIFILPQNIIVFGVLVTKSITQNTMSYNMYELFYVEYKKAPPPVGRL